MGRATRLRFGRRFTGGLAVAVIIAGLAGTRLGVTLPGQAVDTVPVLRVVDGDTIRVVIDGREATVRYIGINTPESVDPRRPVERLGKEASERNRGLVEGKGVRLEKDVSETDRFGRLLRYVWIEDRMVNAVLVEEGYARAVSYPPDVKYQELFMRLEQEAREARRGLWAE